MQCTGFSLLWLLLWSTGSRHVGSVVVAHGLSSCGLWALELRFSSCGTQTQSLRGMWDLPGPGFELMSPALAGGFLTTAPPGKSQGVCFDSKAKLPMGEKLTWENLVEFCPWSKSGPPWASASRVKDEIKYLMSVYN